MSLSHCHKFPIAALLATVAMLTAGCGGGGGDSPPPPAFVRPVEPAAVTSVPPPDYDNAMRLSAFKRLNEVRAAAGLGLLKQNKLVDAAAQAHSVYQILNGVVTHDEVRGAPGFTGSSQTSRIYNAGYSDFTNSNEFAATLPYPGTPPDEAGANLIDSLMGTPFHRNGMLSYEYTEMGIGVHKNGTSATITIDFVRNNNNMQGAPNTLVSIWPPAESTKIPTTMQREEPDPIPENNGRLAGYPATVKVNSRFRNIYVNTFEIREESGSLVDTKLLSYETKTSNNDGTFVGALPRSPLKKNTRYQVNFTGKIRDNWTGEETPISRNWSFNTGEREIF